ncbi:cellulase family glycosylhydrolase [Paenibacillus wynnii]|uniref:cellulase family glycosylhydrolase n=1 Tax=Paenibacillus wynnii TaxID=268407 RepID=UPI00278E5BDA|nr:cellulase family glycosylhydrolase [Paenibacillus wynnii]MDQ0194154.1 aryl-phospho-beta-D-glucosidase BglC (GH1 family) [Paenibacillus wynnii]
MTKRTTKSFILTVVTTLLLSLFSTVASAAPGDDQKASSTPQSKLQSYVDDMQPGWNLGNTLDAVGADETAWGNPRVTKELIQQIAKQGYKSIRIPITWDQHIGPAPGYTIDPAYLDRVQEVVGWALDSNLYVMINLHHDSWLWVSSMEKNHDIVFARYKSAWTQIADRFKNYPDKLMFESINEPRFSEGGTVDESKMTQMLGELNVSFHEIVRKSGGLNAVRPLVLPTLYTSPEQARLDELYKSITMLNDPNLIATVHYYGFWPFSVNIAGYTTFEKDTKNDIIQTFDKVYNTFVARGIPVIVGEYGLLGFDRNTGVIEQGEKLKFFEFLSQYLESKDITSMLWDNGQHFNRTTYKWSDPELYNVLMASLKGRSANAESDLIYLTKGAEIQNTNVNLNLNGNKLTVLRLKDGKTLHKGKDYELNGEVLTLKASLLNQLTTSGQLGVNAVLTAEFNKGTDWNFKVIVSDTPAMSNTTGTTASFAVPTTFNGDQLATMEAVYASGGNAGPQNWTAFKEFGYTFEPSYATNEIKLFPNFWSEVHDGEVILKFHFWSGKVVTYSITKSGTSIVGKAL